MHVFGFSLNNLSLMALTLCVGFVVDDAIVMLENIVRHVEQGEKPFDAALKGSREIGIRSEERRVGKECVSRCRSRGSTYHKKKKKTVKIINKQKIKR